MEYNKKDLISKRKYLLVILFSLFLINSCLGLENFGTFKQNENIRIAQICSDATQINISSISYPNSTIAVSNIEMLSAGSGEFYYDFNLTDTEGRYDVRGVSDGCERTFSTYLIVSLSGQSTEYYFIISDIILLLAVIFLTFILWTKYKNRDFDKVQDDIISKHKNAGQTLVKGIINSVFKNSFIWLYFLGWIMILILKDIVYRFNSSEIYTYFVLISNIYSLGLLLVTVFMIGYTISYMRNIFGILEDNDWGISG